MTDTSFIKDTDQKAKEQRKKYNEYYTSYYNIKPEKKKDTGELYFTKEQEKEQLKILNTSLNVFKKYFIKNCKSIVKEITKQVKTLEKPDREKSRIKKQLFIQVFESELSYLKEIINTPKLSIFLRKHIEFKLDIYSIAIK